VLGAPPVKGRFWPRPSQPVHGAENIQANPSPALTPHDQFEPDDNFGRAIEYRVNVTVARWFVRHSVT